MSIELNEILKEFIILAKEIGVPNVEICSNVECVKDKIKAFFETKKLENDIYCNRKYNELNLRHAELLCKNKQKMTTKIC